MTVRSEVADYFNMNVTDDPYWSESSWFSWHIPEKNINGAFYNHFRPNMNCMLAGAFMWDGSGQLPWTSLYFDWQAMRVLPKGKYGRDYNKYDFATPWGMSIRMLKPLKRYHLKYDREGFKLDLVFEAIHEPHEIGARDAHGLKRAYNFHFEQPGRIKGTVVCDGAEYHVDFSASATARTARAFSRPSRPAATHGRPPTRRPDGMFSLWMRTRAAIPK